MSIKAKTARVHNRPSAPNSSLPGDWMEPLLSPSMSMSRAFLHLLGIEETEEPCLMKPFNNNSLYSNNRWQSVDAVSMFLKVK